MKKIFIFFAIVIIIVSIFGVKYYSYVAQRNEIIRQNSEYEQYKDKEIYGLEVGTLINKTTDRNQKNSIEKDGQGTYIDNKKDSMRIDISVIDGEEIHQIPMEKIHENGTEIFITLYRDIKFKCSKIEYHESTGKIKYLLFEQIQ